MDWFGFLKRNMQSNIIKLEKLTRSFTRGKEHRGIFNASLNISQGEVVCVLGPSGSGKTTLLRLIAGLEKSDGGTLYSDPSLQHSGEVVYVPQDYTLWPHLTVIKNLTLVPCVVGKRQEREVEKEAEALLSRFRLREYVSAYPHELSGGQKQRVALLRALMVRPRVLLLDEVTSALDPELTKSVLDMIRTLAKDGYTMVVVTHHVSLALAIADRIIFLDEGRIIEDTSAVSFFQEQTNPRIMSFIRDVIRRDRAIEVFEGVEQFQAYHLGLLKRLPVGSTIHVAGAVGDRWYAPMGDFYDVYESLRIQKKITWKMTLYEFSERDKALLKRFPTLNEFRLMPRALRNPANYNVMEDSVIIQIFGDIPTILEIKDKAVAEAYMKFFEELWAVSSTIN